MKYYYFRIIYKYIIHLKGLISSTLINSKIMFKKSNYYRVDNYLYLIRKQKFNMANKIQR
jgi:hypothetical protein